MAQKFLDRVSEIGISLLFIPGFVLIMGLTTYWYLSKFIKMDKSTSVYASIPGGLNEMVILGQELGADPRTLVLIHATRIVVVVFLASFVILFVPKLDIQTLPQPDLFYNWLNYHLYF